MHRILGNRILALQLAERVDEMTQGRSVSTLYQALIANGKSQQVVDHARAHTKEITNLAKGAAILIISQDLDELIEISDRFGALYEGRLSQIKKTAGLTIEDIGLMMGSATAEATP